MRVLLLIALTASSALARCGDDPGDAAAVAAARAQVATDCDCSGAPRHGDHVRWAAAVATIRTSTGQLRAECASPVKRCAARSTCGRRGAATCCRTLANGRTKCTIKRSAASCTAPAGGHACAGSAASCCDACGATGCAAATTTTTVPGPCNALQFPTCGGSCGAGQKCQSTVTVFGQVGSATCECVDAGSICVPGAPTATCPGACPVSYTCGSDVAFPGECFCRAQMPCAGGSGFPTCGGSCDAGSTCVPFRLGAFFSDCVCVPSGVACDATCGGGEFPAGMACTFQLSGGTPTCACDPLP